MPGLPATPVRYRTSGGALLTVHDDTRDPDELIGYRAECAGCGWTQERHHGIATFLDDVNDAEEAIAAYRAQDIENARQEARASAWTRIDELGTEHAGRCHRAPQNATAAPGEFPSEPGSLWRDRDGDEWVLCTDGHIYMTDSGTSPADAIRIYGPMTPITTTAKDPR